MRVLRVRDAVGTMRVVGTIVSEDKLVVDENSGK